MRVRRPNDTPVSLRGLSHSLAAALVLAVPAMAQQQFAEFGKRAIPLGHERTSAIAVGDVDGDGDPDVVFGNDGYRASEAQNRLHINDGSGTYEDVTTARMPVDYLLTRAIALGDVDGDGDLDMISGNYGQENRLYLNDGTGRFSDVTAASMPFDSDQTHAVALGDVDGDGDLDVAFGNEPFMQDRLYLNDGAGRFTDVTATRLPASASVTVALAFGDVDSDGDLDLVAGSGYQRQNRLYVNDGSGSFTDATAGQMPVDADTTWSVALGDVDADGDVDILCGNEGQDRLYSNDGNGRFTDATTARMPVDGDTTLAVALGDVDGDGDLDVAFGTSGQNRLYVNDGTGRFVDATVGNVPAVYTWSPAVALSDADSDGDLDMLFGNGEQNRLYLNDGAGRFTDASARGFPVEMFDTVALALGDLDSDGDLDLVLATRPRQRNRLYLNDGAGGYSDATVARLPAASDPTSSLAIGDVDGDGDLDIVFGQMGYRTIGARNRLYLNDGAGHFTDVTASRMPRVVDRTYAVLLVDVDGDGDLDVVLGNSGDGGGRNGLLLNDGAGTFTDATAARMPNHVEDTHGLAAGDVDSDGDPDLVIGNSRQNRLYLNDGSGRFVDATSRRLPLASSFTIAVTLGDVDTDGDVDLLAVSSDRGPARLYRNDGRGSFTDVTATQMPADDGRAGALALGDLDGDGDLDVVKGNAGSGIYRFSGEPNRLYLNDGRGRFADATDRTPDDRDQTVSLALGDVDGDGDTDVVAGNLSRADRLYVNLVRQLEGPLVPRIGRSFRLEAYARYGPRGAVDVALPFLSAGTASIPLPPLGTIGIDVTRTVALPPFVIPQPAGLGSVVVPVPAAPTLVGGAVHAQALIVPFPLTGRLTNVTSDVVVR